MKINRQTLLALYLQEIDYILDHCETKTHFSAEECVNIVAHVLETHPETFRMHLSDFSTEELLQELERRKISSDELRFKSENVDGAKWSDLTLVYSVDEYMGERRLKIAPFFQDEFCYHNLGAEVIHLLPNNLSESEECIFEYFGGKTPEEGIEFLKGLGFKMRQDDEFFAY